MSNYSKPIDLLVYEWGLCDAGMARYDTLSFSIRSWAMAAYGTALAASVVTGGRLAAYVPPILLILIGACWWADGLSRTLQDHFMRRATTIQLELQRSFAAPDRDEYLQRFMEAEPWIGPSFAAIPGPLRGKSAIIHMAWQPHIRWFYLPLFMIALIAWLGFLADPTDPRIAPSDERLWTVIVVLVGAWLFIRSTRASVDKWRAQDAEDQHAAREARLRDLQQETRQA